MYTALIGLKSNAWYSQQFLPQHNYFFSCSFQNHCICFCVFQIKWNHYGWKFWFQHKYYCGFLILVGLLLAVSVEAEVSEDITALTTKLCLGCAILNVLITQTIG